MRCLECGRQWTDRRERWRVYVYDGRGDEEPVTGAYCPSCARREFGDSGDTGRHRNPTESQ
jgi:hypothetical protein